MRITQKLLFLFILPYLAFPARAAGNGPPLPDYPFQQVAENAWVIHGPLEMPNPDNQGFMNNPGLVITSAGAVIVDPGSSLQSGEMVLRRMKSVTDLPVVAVFNTHVHGDHWLGNQAIRAAYPEVAIYAHPQMLAAVEAGAGDTWVGLMERLTEGATRGTRVVAPDHTVDHGEEVQVGDRSFRIHHYGQAHTKTDIMIEIKQDGIVFLGDNVTAKRIPRMVDGTFMGNIASIDRILEIPAQVWIPGHGLTGDADMVRTYRSYLENVYQAAARAFADDLDSSDAKPLAIKATAAFHDWAGYEDEIGRHAGQAFLEVEAAEF